MEILLLKQNIFFSQIYSFFPKTKYRNSYFISLFFHAALNFFNFSSIKINNFLDLVCSAVSANVQFNRMIKNNNFNNNNNKSNTNNYNKNNNQSSNAAAVTTSTVAHSSATSGAASTKVKTSFSQHQQHQQEEQLPNVSLSAIQPNQSAVNPTSPSISLPPLKKRTAVVKQTVPPPVPPRGSPRSKSKSKSKSSDIRKFSYSAMTNRANYLEKLDEPEIPGCEKVKAWLEKSVPRVPIPVKKQEKFQLTSAVRSFDSEEDFVFKSVRTLIDSFSKLEGDSNQRKSRSFGGRDKIGDSSLVRARIENYNLLERDRIRNDSDNDKTLIMTNTLRSDQTDSGIDINSRKLDILQKMGGNCEGSVAGGYGKQNTKEIARLVDQFSLEGEFV